MKKNKSKGNLNSLTFFVTSLITASDFHKNGEYDLSPFACWVYAIYGKFHLQLCTKHLIVLIYNSINIVRGQLISIRYSLLILYGNESEKCFRFSHCDIWRWTTGDNAFFTKKFDKKKKERLTLQLWQKYSYMYTFSIVVVRGVLYYSLFVFFT